MVSDNRTANRFIHLNNIYILKIKNVEAEAAGETKNAAGKTIVVRILQDLFLVATCKIKREKGEAR